MKTITSIVFIISFSILSFSQGNRDKIKTLKIAFITEKLDLSEQEAQKFWPIYNKYDKKEGPDHKGGFQGDHFKIFKNVIFLKFYRNFGVTFNIGLLEQINN